MKLSNRHYYLLAIFCFSPFVVGCVSQQVRIDDSSEDQSSLTTAETIETISGELVKQIKSSEIHGTGENLIEEWDGDEITAKGKVKDDGTDCLTIIKWDESDECPRYKIKDSKIALVYKGKSDFWEIGVKITWQLFRRTYSEMDLR